MGVSWSMGNLAGSGGLAGGVGGAGLGELASMQGDGVVQGVVWWDQ